MAESRVRRPEDVIPRADREKLRATPPSEGLALMEATPMERADDPGPGWLFEPLLGGTRCLAVHDGESLRLLEEGTRPLPLRGRAERLAEAIVAAGPEQFAVDGEIVDVDPRFEQGLVQPEDARLPDDDREREVEPRFVAFDLPFAAGYDLRTLALRERKRLLNALFRFTPAFMHARDSSAPGKLVFERACREGWKGVVAKRADSPYVAGPSPDWKVWRRPRG